MLKTPYLNQFTELSSFVHLLPSNIHLFSPSVNLHLFSLTSPFILLHFFVPSLPPHFHLLSFQLPSTTKPQHSLSSFFNIHQLCLSSPPKYFHCPSHLYLPFPLLHPHPLLWLPFKTLNSSLAAFLYISLPQPAFIFTDLNCLLSPPPSLNYLFPTSQLHFR